MKFRHLFSRYIQGRFLSEYNKFVSFSLSIPAIKLPSTHHAFPSFLLLSPSLSFRALVLLLFVPNRVARRPRCPTDRPRRLLYLYSGLRVLQGTYVSRSTRESAIHIPPFYRVRIHKRPTNRHCRPQLSVVHHDTLKIAWAELKARSPIVSS